MKENERYNELKASMEYELEKKRHREEYAEACKQRDKAYGIAIAFGFVIFYIIMYSIFN